MAGTINKPKKPKSKRQPTRLRHRIEKAAAAKQRKQRKLAKKNPEWRTKLKKDPGIPNLFPYKEKLLLQIEEAKNRKQEETQRRREMAKEAKKAAKAEAEAEDGDAMEGDDLFDDDEDGMEVEEEDNVDDSNPMAALLASARRAAKEYKKKHQNDDDEDMDEDFSDDDDDEFSDEDDERSHVIEVQGSATSRKAFDKVFKQVVDQADVVLYVLDARDPESTRSRDVERAILEASSADAGGKRLILVLNKADLVPPPVLHAWLTHLRGFFPTLPLRASGAAANAHTFHHRDLTVQSTSAALFRALKSFAAGRNLKRAVSVGVIGYPNVGKSSVINALLSRVGGHRSACPAGAEAGVTTAIRSVKIDSKLTLLDSPGIVFPSTAVSSKAGGKSSDQVQAHLVLLNAVPPKLIEDPVPAVTLLLQRLQGSGVPPQTSELMNKLASVYDLPPLMSTGGDITTDFLVQVARKRGRLGRGGVPNIHAAAMTVITDWRDGRIQGWVDAPVFGLGASGVAAPATSKKADAQAVTGIPAATITSAPVDQKSISKAWAKEFDIDALLGDVGGEDEVMAE